MKRLDRIKNMEKALNASSAAVNKLAEAMDGYERAQGELKALFDYYGSMKWREDREADEEGKLPEDLPRGVLSEDAVYDLIIEHRELMARLAKAVAFSIDENLF